MDTSEDKRKEIILRICESYFRNSLEKYRHKILTNEIVDNFLDEQNHLSLSVFLLEEDILLKNQAIHEENSKNALIFYKAAPCIITDENMAEVIRICSFQNRPIDGFYNILQRVYIPAIFQGDENMANTKLQTLMENMEAGLRTAVVQQKMWKTVSNENCSIVPAILTLKDECDYWDYVKSNNENSKERLNAQKILQILKPLDQKFSEANNLDNAEELLEEAYNAFDDVWKLNKFNFPEENMKNLFDIIGNAVCHIIQNTLNKVDLWTDSYYKVNDLLLWCIEICNKWMETCTQLTKIFWPHYSSHPWTGPVHQPGFIQNFAKRLREILDVRDIHHNISLLLSNKEKEELQIVEHFKAFEGINVIQYNPYTENIWRSAMNNFNRNLQPVEEFVGKKIKEKLTSCSTNILQSLEWFKRYQNIIKKEEIRQMLKSERQNFFTLLNEYVNEMLLTDMFSSKAIAKKFPSEFVDLPEIILKIMWIKEILDKVRDIKKIAETILNDLNEYDKFADTIVNLTKDLHSSETDSFNRWYNDTVSLISRAELSLKTEDPVVYFEQNKLMVVNYEPKLMKLIQEVHQLQLLGYEITSSILAVTNKAKLFTKQAKALEQVANFHNTIGDRMIPSQRPMMLTLAMELSNLVKTENTVTWSNLDTVDAYISRLQSVVNRLSSDNNELYRCHVHILQKVAELIDADLLQQKNKWRDIMREIRDVIDDVGRKFANSETWTVHWDYQLYKVLQYRYQIGLMNLNECLPDMKVQLIYRQQKLQFNPPIEEIKMRYYNELKRFITLPLTFQGVSKAASSIFPIMVTKNKDQFQQVYSNAELAFNKLLALQDEWVDKIALGAVDLEGLVKDHVKTADDWDANFKASKSWGQEIAKIINYEHKVECFVVSIAPARSEIELHNTRYWDVLSISLYASIMVDVNTIEAFIVNAKKSLDYQPQSFEEISDAKDTYNRTLEKLKDITNILEEMNKKNLILAAWTKDRVNQVANVKQEWANFQSMLENQQFYIDRQVDSIKSKLTAEAENLASELEKFLLRWQRSRPKETDLVGGDYAVISRNIKTLQEKREEWNTLAGNIEKIERDYGRFGINVPESLERASFEKEFKECEEIWGVYENFLRSLDELNTEEWIVFRGKSVAKFDLFVQTWREKLEKMEITPLTARLLSDLHKYKDFAPLIKYLKGDVFGDKHWSELCAILKIPVKSVDKLIFGDFLKAQDAAIANVNALQELNNRAASEVVIRQALAELDIWEVECKFSLITQLDSKGKEMHFIKDFKDVLSKIGDNQFLLQSMVGTPNYEQYRDHISMWETKLINLEHYLRNLNEIQRKWLYLEPIFMNETMKIEKARFERIDKDFRYVLNSIQNGDQRVASLCRISNLRNIVDTLSQQLNICQKSLNEYLEEKRLKFPRFYFLCDDDLLEILGQANKAEIVQSHLKKIFAGIESVVFDKNNIVAVRSARGKIVTLRKTVTISLDVENWLEELSLEMGETLKQLLVACLKEVDPLTYPSQILCLAESISFTYRCEDAIKSGKLKSLSSSLEKQLETYTKLDLELEDEDTSILELKLKALIFDTIYRAYIVKELIRKSVTSTDDWHWQKRLRFYLRGNSHVIIKMVDAEFTYSYEYQGNPQQLVQTPLTDRCYLTLTQAMSLGLGGNPYGPAGTGKTESVKALGRLFGRQVLVFNCDEGLDIQSLTRILIGLVKCGAWGCFDEFNRLEEATLSAVSTHLHVIQDALRNNAKNISLVNKQIELNSNTGIFVTMNPAGKGYGGRQKLPDNLKQLFRPIAMSVPDDLQIAEVILFGEGFKNAKLIAKKLVEIFDMAKKVLSQQKHYDWGLRALKTVIGGCKTALKIAKRNADEKTNELALVVRTIKLNTLSRLTFDDAEQFDRLINDTFQREENETRDENVIEAAITKSFDNLGLQYNARQARKCLELYEQMEQRMGVVVVGPSGAGKSTIRRLLKEALIVQKRVINEYTINPKSMPRTQLLGQIDEDTRQWMDGILSFVAQKAYNEPSNVESWIVFDGDIDPEWIESLNSVLDDNRLLTLPSGWRIHFGSNVHFLFETDCLQHASPATVSRMGIILTSEQDLDVGCIVRSWLRKQSEDCRHQLKDFIDGYFYETLEWIRTKGELVAASVSVVTLLRNCLSLINSRVTSKLEFSVSLLNGFGCILTPTSRETFSKYILDRMEEFIPDANPSSYCYFNTTRDCIDCYVSEYDKKLGIVKTAQMKACADVLKRWIDNEESFMLFGSQGIGKSQLLDYCASDYRGIKIVTVHCSSHITPTHILQKLNQECIIVTGNNGMVFRPKKSERLILYLKDLNLVGTDKWGSSMLVSFLHQILTYKGFYDQSHLDWVHIERIQLVCSLQTCGELNSRFVNCNNVMFVSSPNDADLTLICTSYLKMLNLSDKLSSVISAIMIAVYTKLRSTFHAAYPSYNFNLRELCDWCVGLRRYAFDNNEDAIRALMYEGMRLFGDLIEAENDKIQLLNILKTVLDAELGRSSILDTLNDLIFIYEDGKLKLVSLEKWTAILQKQLSYLENEGESVDSKILQPQLAKVVAYFERVLTLPGGSLFLPGYSGFGRKSAVRVVAARQSAKIFSLKVSTGYGINQFKNDLKTMLHMAGLEDQIVYFTFEDYQAINDTIVDYINSLLASGEIPGLYKTGEFETMCSPLKDVLNQNDFQGTPSQFFVERVRRNVRAIIIADVDRNESTTNVWKSNSILARCQTIWLHDWSEQTKLLVLRSILKRTDEKFDRNEKKEERSDIDDNLTRYFVNIHENASKWMKVTPRHFVLLAKTFLIIKREKESSIVDKDVKLKAGLSKLIDAKSVVAELKKDAAEQETKLAEKQSKANAALELITKTMQNASVQKTEMETLKGSMEKENEMLAARKVQIDAELAEVEPILAEARSAVGNIKAESLSEIRSLRAPPDVIRDILEGVLRLMGIQDTSWNSMKTFLAKRGVKEDIRCFDARNIFAESRNLVEELLRERSNSFEEKTAKRASVAAAPLARWVMANVKYSKILDKIQPLEMEQAKLQNKLKQSKDEISLLSSGLENVSQNVSKLKEQLNSNTKEAAEIEVHLSKVQETITAAEDLVNKLDEEYSRWNEQVIEISSDMTSLPFNCLLSSATMIYLSQSPEDVRRTTVEKWRQMLQLKTFRLEKFLSSEQEQLRFLSEGLPSDYLSVQNAVIISQLSEMECENTQALTLLIEKGIRFRKIVLIFRSFPPAFRNNILQNSLTPFVIDPSNIASEWLTKQLKKNKTVDVVSQHNPRFYTFLELSVRFGKSLIVQDVANVDPILVPILRGNCVYRGARKLILVGDKLIDYNPTFRLYLICRDSTIQLPSYFTTLLTIINFEITFTGLSQQLLRCALSVEKPELEEKHRELLIKEEQLKTKLFALQDSILIELANAQGNVLENKELLVTLKESKKSSAEVEIALAESRRIRDELSEEYEIYKPIAKNASKLYFSVLALRFTNNFYQISVENFVKIYKKIFTSTQEEIEFDIDRRLRNLIQFVYAYVSRFLFKKDLLAFALHLTREMHPNLFGENEWELFNRDIVIDFNADSPQVLKALPAWANKEQAFDAFLLKHTLPNLYDALDINNVKFWQDFVVNQSFNVDAPLTAFQQVLVIQAFKAGFLHSALVNFAENALGLRRLSPSSQRLDKLLGETNSTEPILLIVSSGVDPSDELRTLAKATVGSNFYEVALGRGQTELALKLLHESAERGYWLIIKNLHLMTSWLPTLEKDLRTIPKIHEEFRLWLTSEPHTNFPSTLIRMCLKVTYETPQGVKRNLERTYNGLNVTISSVENAKIVFVLAWFHAIVQERRTFIPQGWQKFYEFSDSDFQMALKVIEKMFANDRKTSIRWSYLHGLCENAIYGGRIDNFEDLRVLQSYLNSYFNDDIVNGKKLLAAGIRIPQSSRIQDFCDFIQKISDSDSPELFALPSNVNLSWQKKRSSDVISQLKMLHNRHIVTNKSDVKEWKLKISPVLHLWKQLNQEVGILKMKIVTEIPNEEPIRKFLAHELNFAINLTNRIHKMLVEINKIVRNSAQSNDRILRIAISIANQQTPEEWLLMWDGNINPIPYIRSTMSRCSFAIRSYTENENTDTLISKPIDLKQFFHPQAFLSVFKQYSCRLCHQSLDNVRLKCLWENTVTNVIATITVTGLLMEGAYIQNSSLRSNSVTSPLLNIIPNFSIAWLPCDTESYKTKTKLEIPVYHNSKRENSLMSIEINVPSHDFEKWILANVAIYVEE